MIETQRVVLFLSIAGSPEIAVNQLKAITEQPLWTHCPMEMSDHVDVQAAKPEL